MDEAAVWQQGAAMPTQQEQQQEQRQEKQYRQQAVKFLQSTFRGISVAAIKATMDNYNQSFPETYRKLEEFTSQDASQGDDLLRQQEPYLQHVHPILLKNLRPNARRPRPRPRHPLLLQEISEMDELSKKKKARKDDGEDDDDLDDDSNLEDDSDEEEDVNASASGKRDNDDETTYECKICYEDMPFDAMVQCRGGHLFCKVCLRMHANEAVYSKRACQILCLEENCPAGFSDQMLDQAITDPKQRQTIHKYITRINIVNATMDDTSQCPNPGCDFVGVLPSNGTIVTCAECKHIYCSKCDKPADIHEGKTCAEVKAESEQNAVDAANHAAAELQTSTAVRNCPGCSISFVKSEGCNKMVCPNCNQKSCYKCGLEIASYDHFCKIPLCDGKSCNTCHMFTDDEKVDRAALRENARRARENALNDNNQAAVEAFGALLDSPGSPESPPGQLRRPFPPQRPIPPQITGRGPLPPGIDGGGAAAGRHPTPLRPRPRHGAARHPVRDGGAANNTSHHGAVAGRHPATRGRVPDGRGGARRRSLTPHPHGRAPGGRGGARRRSVSPEPRRRAPKDHGGALRPSVSPVLRRRAPDDRGAARVRAESPELRRRAPNHPVAAVVLNQNQQLAPPQEQRPQRTALHVILAIIVGIFIFLGFIAPLMQS